ncbi:benzoylformate decarboxylase [Pseudomonas aeruginosa]|uniref:benzoylformate decarboxylase n=1 Tax=Pseudomonas aeruginosa TaxID=287 RepID=UPI003FD1CED5
MSKSPSCLRYTASVREVTLQLLRELNMTTVFGNPGSTELAFLSHWPEDFRYILGLQEAAVVGMADGYARATGRAAFVNLHSAAGVGNALGNIFSAYKNQTPLVISAGQQARSLLLHEAYLAAERAADFPRPYVKWSCEPARAEDVPAAIARAYHIAMQPPYGPTFVSIPCDDWDVQVEYQPAHRAAPAGPANAQALDELLASLRQARRPVLVAGSEVGLYHAYPQLVELAERLGAEVWTAPVSHVNCFPERHPLFAGFLPAIPEGLSQALAPYDLVLVVGAPAFTFHVPGEFALPNAHLGVFQLTVDAESAARARTRLSLVGDLALSLEQLLAGLASQAPTVPSTPLRQVPRLAPGERLDAAYVLQELGELLPDNAVLVEEAPSHRPALQRHLPILRPSAFHTMASGGLGYGLPAAIGMALAGRGEKIVALIGDGSMMYSIQALWSAAQERLPVAFIVLNNSGYGAMRSFSRLLGSRDVPGIDIEGLDFPALAQGFGVAAQRVSHAGQLHESLRGALAASGPVLVEILVDPDQGDIY